METQERVTNKRCPICNTEKEKNKQFCNKHIQAYIELKKGYEQWLVAYGTLTWEEYLKKLNDIEGVGKFIQEVIEYEIFFKAPNSRRKERKKG